jgi:hypothetical protein
MSNYSHLKTYYLGILGSILLETPTQLVRRSTLMESRRSHKKIHQIDYSLCRGAHRTRLLPNYLFSYPCQNFILYINKKSITENQKIYEHTKTFNGFNGKSNSKKNSPQPFCCCALSFFSLSVFYPPKYFYVYL